MKTLIAMLGAVALVSGSASAQEAEWIPHFTKGPKPADYLAAFPPRALAEKLTGEVQLDCTATAQGALVDCKVATETPPGYGFGEAALKVVGVERIKTKDGAGQSVAGRPVRTNLEFLAPGDSNPDWLNKPTSEELVAVYPVPAMKKRVDGAATLNCGVTVEGFLENCKAMAEQPMDLGFGVAALQLVPQFRMTPKMRGGKAVPGTVTFRVEWVDMSDFGGGGGRKVILDPPWIATATAADLRAAWPANSKAKAGSAAVSCRLTSEGKLRGCTAISQTPESQGFGRASVALARSFRVRLKPEEAKDAANYSVDIPFRFRNPSEPDTRRVVQPTWIRALTVEGALLVFPSKAKAAGVYNGLGVINCLVEIGGGLSDCKVLREDPVDLGFGEAAIKAAGYMTMNSWSVDGDPLDGLRVTVPVRLVIDPPAPAPTP